MSRGGGGRGVERSDARREWRASIWRYYCHCAAALCRRIRLLSSLTSWCCRHGNRFTCLTLGTNLSSLSVHGFYITRDDRDKRWNDFDRYYTTETCEKNNMIISRLNSNPWRLKFQLVVEYMADRNTSNYDFVFVFSCNANYSKKNFVQLGHLQVPFASKVII